ncbi:skin secretory protein xP2-like [Motacilla alba alba]|uniref:skin secretory protein xP2-like n=1 Tax=Motacilla alba alba TaxID=1094192 RepID=UPI0018D598B7|nr:skin secretory protein xP2-like [Motacilla alba alba]
MGIGRRFPRDFTPALCLAPRHPTGLGLTEEGRGYNAKSPSRAGPRVPEPARGRGAVPPPPPRPERGPRRAGGSGNSRSQAPPPARFDGKTPNTSPKHRGTGQPPLPAALCHACYAAFVPPPPAQRSRSRSRSGQSAAPPGPRGARAGKNPAAKETPAPRRSLPSLCTPARGSAPQHLDNKSCRRAEWAGLGSAPPAHTPLEPIDVQMPMGPRGLEPRTTHTAALDPPRGPWGRVQAPARWSNCRGMAPSTLSGDTQALEGLGHGQPAGAWPRQHTGDTAELPWQKAPGLGKGSSPGPGLEQQEKPLPGVSSTAGVWRGPGAVGEGQERQQAEGWDAERLHSAPVQWKSPPPQSPR